MRQTPEDRLDRPGSADPLSEVISLLGIKSTRCTRLEAGGKWALRFPAKPALKFVAVLRGRCWIALPDNEPCLLKAGDTFLLANSPAYVLANDREKTPQDGLALFDWAHSNLARHGGNDTILLGGSFAFEAGNAQLLLEALPVFMHLPVQDPAAAFVRGTLKLLDREIRNSGMGASLIAHHLADILLIQVLRAYAAMHVRRVSG